jgi:hypothetical protein
MKKKIYFYFFVTSLRPFTSVPDRKICNFRSGTMPPTKQKRRFKDQKEGVDTSVIFGKSKTSEMLTGA